MILTLMLQRGTIQPHAVTTVASHICVYMYIYKWVYSFKEEDIISEWDFTIDTVKAAPAAAPIATNNTNRKTTKRQLLDNVGQQQQKRSSIHSVSSIAEQLLKRRSSTANKDETTSVDESEISTATEEVIMDLSSKQPEALPEVGLKFISVNIKITDIFTFCSRHCLHQQAHQSHQNYTQ